MEPKTLHETISKIFNTTTLPNLMNFIRIPNTSPEFDPEWDKNNLLLKASKLIITFIKTLQLKNTEITLLKDENHTPFILTETKSSKEKEKNTILFYAHIDKQPNLLPSSSNFTSFFPNLFLCAVNKQCVLLTVISFSTN